MQAFDSTISNYQTNQVPIGNNRWNLLVAVWVIVQIAMYLFFGIVVKGESIKYTNEAIYFDQHLSFSQPKYLFYASYILIRWIDFKLSTGYWFTYLLQLLANFLAVVSFYKFIQKQFNSPSTGFISSLVLILCLPWQSWTTHLYTESLFLSLLVLFGISFLQQEKTRTDWLLTFGLLVLLVFTRPTGLLLIPVVGICLWLEAIRSKRWISLIGLPVLAIIGFYFLLNYAMKGEGEFDFMKPFVEEHLICGVPGNARTDLRLSDNGNTLEGLVFYVLHNPEQFFSLAIKKFLLFFGMTRPHYSAAHNLALQLFFYPLYLAALVGLVAGWRKYRSLVRFSLLLIACFTLSVVLSCDDWLNRFIMPVLPFILLLAVTGIKEVYNKIQLSNKVNP